MISPRHLLFTIATFGLIAALVFLYNKTEAVDLSERNEIVSLLRELQEIEGRWDIDVLRMRMEMGSSQMSAPNRTIAAQNALKALANAVPHINSPSLSENLGAISRAITEKAELIEKFKAANGNSREALLKMMSIADEPIVAEEKPGKVDVRQKEFTQALNQLAAAASGYYWLEQDTQRKALENAAAQVLGLASAMDAAVHGKASAMNDAAQVLLKSKPIEQELSSKVALLTSGPRLNGLAISFNRELEATLGEKERFRVYMIAYAAALLIGIGYLGVRIVAANETLEHRVTDRTRELSDALRHLKESEAQLIQSEKMSSLGQMVAGVAHEINTPLAYVSNSLTAVSDRLPDITDAIVNCEKLLALLHDPNVQPDDLNRQFVQAAAQLDRIKQHEVLTELAGLVKDGIYGAGQVAEIVSNLKDFSRLDRSKMSSFNLNDGLNSTLGLARHMLKSIKVTKNFGGIPAITCAPSQINQVFLNLITNAVQALPPQNGEITLSTRSENDGVTVEVADNGTGIPPDVLPKIFDPFFTTKEIGKGTGLGLSISYQIIKDHGGRINVESQPGRGTKFTVWVPLKSPSETKLSA
ncbi:MAG TPA: ATP-binding protein [Gallionella sp.]|nr:ATP-binding protein [Gallionella sp.]